MIEIAYKTKPMIVIEKNNYLLLSTFIMTMMKMIMMKMPKLTK